MVEDAEPAPQRQSTADEREPSEERTSELRAAYAANAAAGRAPYAGVEIRSPGELAWVRRERRWSGEMDANGRGRIDLRGAILDGLDLSGASLVEANLGGAHLASADLSRANLFEANLAGADLFRACLASADLTGANLSGSRLYRASLTGADLYRANLAGASLAEADLSRADLGGARMDLDTNLGAVILDGATCLGDVKWNDAPAARVDWSQTRWRLGDERAIQAANGRKRIMACRDAARAYRGLSLALRDQGLLIPAAQFRLREQRLERQALWHERKPLAWLGSLLLDWVSGYGERPARAFRAYAVVVLTFAAFYFALTNGASAPLTGGSQPLRWYEALVLSVSSFHGRGFFPAMITVGDPIAIVAACEAVIGLFIELIFIATFSRRFLGN